MGDGDYQAEYWVLSRETRKLTHLDLVAKLSRIKPDNELVVMFCSKCQVIQHATPTGICSDCEEPPPLVIQEPELG